MNNNLKEKEFRKFVESLPKTHWAKYDLSAVRLGWDARIEAQKEKNALIHTTTLNDVETGVKDEFAMVLEYKRDELTEYGITNRKAAKRFLCIIDNLRGKDDTD